MCLNSYLSSIKHWNINSCPLLVNRSDAYFLWNVTIGTLLLHNLKNQLTKQLNYSSQNDKQCNYHLNVLILLYPSHINVRYNHRMYAKRVHSDIEKSWKKVHTKYDPKVNNSNSRNSDMGNNHIWKLNNDFYTWLSRK